MKWNSIFVVYVFSWDASFWYFVIDCWSLNHRISSEMICWDVGWCPKQRTWKIPKFQIIGNKMSLHQFRSIRKRNRNNGIALIVRSGSIINKFIFYEVSIVVFMSTVEKDVYMLIYDKSLAKHETEFFKFIECQCYIIISRQELKLYIWHLTYFNTN